MKPLPVVMGLGIAPRVLPLGVLFLQGRGASLIAGCHTASPEERARSDKKAPSGWRGWPSARIPGTDLTSGGQRGNVG